MAKNKRPKNAPKGNIGPYTEQELSKFRNELPLLAAPTRHDFQWLATVDVLQTEIKNLHKALGRLLDFVKEDEII